MPLLCFATCQHEIADYRDLTVSLSLSEVYASFPFEQLHADVYGPNHGQVISRATPAVTVGVDAAAMRCTVGA